MAEYRRSFLPPDPTGADRWAIQGGDYRWYLPDRLTQTDLRLGDATLDLLERVTQLMRRLGEDFRSAPHPALYATLLRSEGIASSRIEGVREDPARVLLADLDETLVPRGSQAVLINRNIDTVRRAVESLATNDSWTTSDIKDLHTALMPSGPHGYRDRIVWISGSTPTRAKYVAPAPEFVPELMADLLDYLRTTDDPVLVQAALSHAQLETIHPWADGNGRTGRALIQAVLGRFGLVSGGVLPISVVLGQRDSGYTSALNAFRYDPRRGESPSQAREQFISFFLRAAQDAVEVAADLMAQVRATAAGWSEKTRAVRAHSAQHRLLELLADRPVLTVSYAQNHIEYTDGGGQRRPYSRMAIGNAFAQLERVGIVQRSHVRDRGSIVYTAREIVDLLVLSERRLGSAHLDTVAAPLSGRARRRTPPLPDHLRPEHPR